MTTTEKLPGQPKNLSQHDIDTVGLLEQLVSGESATYELKDEDGLKERWESKAERVNPHIILTVIKKIETNEDAWLWSVE